MKKVLQKIPHALIIVIMVFSVFATIHAAEGEYTLLRTLPGVGDTTGGIVTIQSYLPAAFNLVIGIAAALAFVMLTLGGITYATSDAITGKSQGKEWIENAIWGLMLVIGAYVILYTINPQILNFTLTLPRPQIASSTATAVVTTMTPQEIADDQAVRARLIGINVNAGACTQGQIGGCTNLNGLHERAVQGLIGLKSACGCAITITGGTEPGHATHGVGRPIVDLADNGLTAWLESKKLIRITGVVKGAQVKMPSDTATMVYEPTGGNPGGTSTGPHWHVVFQ